MVKVKPKEELDLQSEKHRLVSYLQELQEQLNDPLLTHVDACDDIQNGEKDLPPIPDTKHLMDEHSSDQPHLPTDSSFPQDQNVSDESIPAPAPAASKEIPGTVANKIATDLNENSSDAVLTEDLGAEQMEKQRSLVETQITKILDAIQVIEDRMINGTLRVNLHGTTSIHATEGVADYEQSALRIREVACSETRY